MMKYFDLDKVGRIRLSRYFFMRDFLYSEIASAFGIINAPDDLDLAVYTGRQLCDELIEPLQETFGRVHIRSGYRSSRLNDFGFRRRLNCAANERTFADHIWDVRDKEGNAGACACVVIPWFLDSRRRSDDWMQIAWWIHDHLPYHKLVFFAYQGAFNIGWRERPQRIISSYLEPKGQLTGSRMLNGYGLHSDQYEGFPEYKGAAAPAPRPLAACNPLQVFSVRLRHQDEQPKTQANHHLPDKET